MSRESLLSYVLFLLFLNITTIISAKPCEMCKGKSVPHKFLRFVLDTDSDGFEYSCEGYENSARFIDEIDERCKSYFQLIGHAKCGCPISEEARKSVAYEPCILCIDGSTPQKQLNKFNILKFGPWEAGDITCLDASGYLSTINANSSLCLEYQKQGVKDCGCPDLLPSAFPSSTTTLVEETSSPAKVPSSSPTFKASSTPSSSPTLVDEKKPDCDALDQGNFPRFHSQYLESTLFDYYLNLVLEENITFKDIALTLQAQLSRIISLEVAAGCSSNQIMTELHQVTFHYVKFDELKNRSGGQVSGTGQVVYSVLPGNRRARRLLVTREEILDSVSTIIKKKFDRIAQNVEGLKGLNESNDSIFEPYKEEPSISNDVYRSRDDEDPISNGNLPSVNVNESTGENSSDKAPSRNDGAKIGFGVGCSFAFLAAGLAFAKGRRLKKDHRIQLKKDPQIQILEDQIEILPTSR